MHPFGHGPDERCAARVAILFLAALVAAFTRSIQRYKDFKDFKKRILATDLFGRGIDIERVNIVINYDFPESKEEGRARARPR